MLALPVLLLAGCVPMVANRGNILDPDRLAEIKPGTSTREEVATKLGTPTQVSTFDEKIWYYFGQQTEQVSFLDPKVTERQTIAIAFNDDGVVTAVNKLSPNDVAAIDPVGRRTPTYGRETTVLEQLVGNLGRPGKLGGNKGER
jgi:outer membrane protein assembly factor BamE (lipoprotein component of BamABCDE complex)